jgi:hypothetical protein
MSTLVQGAKAAAEHCGIHRHSVEYSLGFIDVHDHLPNSQVLELATMCGHGMVSFNFARKMLDMVREGRRKRVFHCCTVGSCTAFYLPRSSMSRRFEITLVASAGPVSIYAVVRRG